MRRQGMKRGLAAILAAAFPILMELLGYLGEILGG